MAKCKNCGKEIAKGLDFCGKECMEACQSKNVSSDISQSELETTLLDPSYMRGLNWRKAKLEAIHKARKQGYSEDWILRMLIRGGLTRATSIRLMNESKEVYG